MGKKKFVSKVLSSFLAAVMLLSVVTGCKANTPKTGTTVAGKTYYGNDVSKHLDIYMDVLGTAPNDMPTVLSQINEKLEKQVNATLHLDFIALSDYTTKYTLLLSSGSNLDLIYSAPWCFFNTEVDKGAFKELTMDYIKKFMPQTYKNESADKWKQIKVKGKIYAVPRNESDYDATEGLVYRSDLAQKYNLGDIKTLDDYQNYLYTIAKNEKGISAYCNMPSDESIVTYFSVQRYSAFDCGGSYGFMWSSKKPFSSKDVYYKYTSPEYKEYALLMADWAKHGVWPSNAIANKIHPDTLFQQGRSASNIGHYKAVSGQIDVAVKNGVAKASDYKYVDIFPSSNVKKSASSGDNISIVESSANPDRAAIVLDVLKNDKVINGLCVGGIEGVHYTDNKDGTYTELAKGLSDYAWGGWTWGIRNDTNLQIKINDTVKAVHGSYANRQLGSAWVLDGFAFDETSVKTQITLINSIVTAYRFSFDLGVFGDNTAAKYDEFVSKLKSAGIEAVQKEYVKQIAAYTGK